MILFVDEEQRRMNSYVEECEVAGFKVSLFSNIDLAWEFLQENRKNIEAVVLDVMLPTGKRFARPASLEGIRTGLEFYRDLRNIYTTLPVILFTQSRDPAIDRVAADDPKTSVHRKQQVTPSDLPQIVRFALGAR